MKRSKLEIAAEVLIALNKDALNGTAVAFAARLNHIQKKDAITDLLHRKLIDFNSEDRKYFPTPRGIDFLNRYIATLEVWDSVTPK